jgi:undecaprenyl-diphosphatase
VNVDIWRAMVLGIVQGLTEFLPISSSAHLILVPYAFGWPDHGQRFDVALHLGTLAALLLYFWVDWMRLALAVVGRSGKADPAERRLAWAIVIGCVPAVIVGIKLEQLAEDTLRNPHLIAVTLIVMGLAMGAADQLGKRVRTLRDLTWVDALWIGCAQALSLVPGVSRSGVTLTAGRALGFRREDAARFSFLLSAPITAGAALFKLRHLVTEGLPPHERLVFGVGILASGLVGYLAISFLLSYLRRGNLFIFVLYRLLLGVLILVAPSLLGPYWVVAGCLFLLALFLPRRSGTVVTAPDAADAS